MTVVTIPHEGHAVVSGMGLPADRDTWRKVRGAVPGRFSIYPRADIGGFEIARPHAFRLVEHLARVTGPFTVRWEVEKGPGRCTSSCWSARSFTCSCACGGENHGTGIVWRRVSEWLEAEIREPLPQPQTAEVSGRREPSWGRLCGAGEEWAPADKNDDVAAWAWDHGTAAPDRPRGRHRRVPACRPARVRRDLRHDAAPVAVGAAQPRPRHPARNHHRQHGN